MPRAIVRAMRLTTILLLAASLISLAGCTQLGYYLQSANGQLSLMRKRVAIEKVVADPDTAPSLRARLERVNVMRDFAVRELGLPDNKSYRSYADLGRDYVVWNVFAAPPLSVDPRTWCFLFVGCISYRGYFTGQRAHAFAAKLAEQGDDTYVAGITAYSTLGHFADPVLNTMLRGDDLYLAGILFHELAHQVVYIRDATGFNESFASLVEEEGVRRWLEHLGAPRQFERWQERAALRTQFGTIVAAAREQLAGVYASDASDAVKLRRKGDVIAQLREQHEQMRRRRGGDTGYEAWFDGPLNNAQLSSVATYRRLVPAFRVLLAESGGDLEVFYDRVAQIGALPPGQRTAKMQDLLAQAATDQVL